MIPLLIFMPLCVFVPGVGENCDYSWTHISDRETFENVYSMYGGKDIPSRVAAFTVMSEQKVFFSSTDMEVAIHEIEHVHCDIKYELTEDKLRCNIIVDIVDRTKHAVGDIDPTPNPPIITAKMEQSQLYSTPYRT